MEYRINEGKHRGQDVFEVIKGSENTGLVLQAYKTREAAEELVETLNRLAPYKARD